MARPSTYDLELCKKICELVSDGKNIIDILELDSKYPSLRTWFRWKDDNDQLWHLYVKAVQNKTEFLNSEIDRLMEKCEDDGITPSQANVLIQTLKWKMSKFYPKMFGDKISLEHESPDGSMSPNKEVDLSNLSDKELIIYKDIQKKIENE